jgi:hypothetical protein
LLPFGMPGNLEGSISKLYQTFVIVSNYAL